MALNDSRTSNFANKLMRPCHRMRGPQLPRTLLEQVLGGDSKDERFKQAGGGRKTQRKAQRLQKKASRVNSSSAHSRRSRDEEKRQEYGTLPATAAPPIQPSRPAKSILKTARPAKPEKDTPPPPTMSSAVKNRLAEHDDEIAALEKKLGLKGKKSTAMQEDGLDWLADASDSEKGADGRGKRKRPEDTAWLQDKRRKATGSVKKPGLGEQEPFSSSGSEDEDDDGSSNGPFSDDEAGTDEDIANPFSDDEVRSEDFDGFDSDNTPPEPPKKKRRENPYVAPPTSQAVSTTKYIPPSLREPPASDEQSLRILRRQLQGQLNRLSESNMLSILQTLEDLYTKNPRQHVTSTLVNLLVGLISNASVLNDTFLILHAGFAEAVYKVIGTDFGAQLLEKIVAEIDRHETGAKGKEVLNLLAFTANLYNFQLVGCRLLFDYIRILLGSLSENNAELLLRVIRTSGQQLRGDDPTALKDIVLLLQRYVHGRYQNLRSLPDPRTTLEHG